MLRYLIVTLFVAPVMRADDLSTQPVVLTASWHLLSQTRFGFSHQESAAFVVYEAETGYRCVEWPSDGLVDTARWEGPIPDGAVAIIHTHPNWMPLPSSIDAHTARVSRIPVYVITRLKITKTNGVASVVVVDGDWKPQPRVTSHTAHLAHGE